MLYREIIAVCSQIHTKHINTLCGQNVELLNVKLGSTELKLVILFWCTSIYYRAHKDEPPLLTHVHSLGLQPFSHFLNKPVGTTAQRETAFKEEQLLTKFP